MEKIDQSKKNILISNTKAALIIKILSNNGEPVLPKTESSRVQIDHGIEKGYEDYYNGEPCINEHPKNAYEMGYEAGWLLAKEINNKQ